jgi:hypothetical protein
MKLWNGLSLTYGRSRGLHGRSGYRTTLRQLATQVAATRISYRGPGASSPLEMGGAEGTRTPDPHTARAASGVLDHA